MSAGADIVAARESTHGDFADTARVAQELKTVLGNGPSFERLNQRQTEVLENIATKLARIVCGDPNFADHWRDIAGYARLGEKA